MWKRMGSAPLPSEVLIKPEIPRVALIKTPQGMAIRAEPQPLWDKKRDRIC